MTEPWGWGLRWCFFPPLPSRYPPACPPSRQSVFLVLSLDSAVVLFLLVVHGSFPRCKRSITRCATVRHRAGDRTRERERKMVRSRGRGARSPRSSRVSISIGGRKSRSAPFLVDGPRDKQLARGRRFGRRAKGPAGSRAEFAGVLTRLEGFWSSNRLEKAR